MPSLANTVTWVARETLLFADVNSPFQAEVYPGQAGLVVIVGDNAAGKSLFYQVVAAKLRQDELQPITISIRERTGAGSSDVAGLRRVLMFGDEATASTGATSVRVMTSGFNQLDTDGRRKVLMLDEPELGLSDGYAAAMGTYIGEQVAARSRQCGGVVVVSHSRALVGALLATRKPTFVYVSQSGAVPLSPSDWLRGDASRPTDPNEEA